MNKINNFWNWFSTNEENLSPEKITNELISEKPHGLIKDKDGTINGKPTYVRVVIKHL